MDAAKVLTRSASLLCLSPGDSLLKISKASCSFQLLCWITGGFLLSMCLESFPVALIVLFSLDASLSICWTFTSPFPLLLGSGSLPENECYPPDLLSLFLVVREFLRTWSLITYLIGDPILPRSFLGPVLFSLPGGPLLSFA